MTVSSGSMHRGCLGIDVPNNGFMVASEKINADWEILRQEFHLFLDSIFSSLKDLHIDVEKLELDHACLRYKSAEAVDILRKQLSEVSTGGKHLSCAVVNGREILIFELLEPLLYQDRKINYIELPYPKESHAYDHDGWEHVEFVLPSDALTKEDFEKDVLRVFPHLHEYNLEMPAVEHEQRPNPSVTVKLAENRRIKFHPLSIRDVIKT